MDSTPIQLLLQMQEVGPEGGAEFVDWGILTVPILMIPIGLM